MQKEKPRRRQPNTAKKCACTTQINAFIVYAGKEFVKRKEN